MLAAVPLRAKAVQTVQHDAAQNFRRDVLPREQAADAVEQRGRPAIVFRHLIAQGIVHGISSRSKPYKNSIIVG